MATIAEKKSVVGLRDMYYALVTQDDANAYAAGTPAMFAPAVSASHKPTKNSKIQYAEDNIFDVLVSEGETAVELEVTGISLDVLSTVLGKGYDPVTGRLFDNGGLPPDVAISFRSLKSNGKYKYFQYLKGKFSTPDEDQATKNDTPDPKTVKITFTAIKTTYQFTIAAGVTDGVKKVEGDDDTSGFVNTGWFTSVQVPSVGSPSALTCTPAPANNATAQTTGVAITLTFSNPLAGNAEVGVALVRQDNSSAITVTRSFNAARTVLTLVHSALTSAKTYNIVLAGVKDVYGQTLADTVYNFATA